MKALSSMIFHLHCGHGHVHSFSRDNGSSFMTGMCYSTRGIEVLTLRFPGHSGGSRTATLTAIVTLPMLDRWEVFGGFRAGDSCSLCRICLLRRRLYGCGWA